MWLIEETKLEEWDRKKYLKKTGKNLSKLDENYKPIVPSS